MVHNYNADLDSVKLPDQFVQTSNTTNNNDDKIDKPSSQSNLDVGIESSVSDDKLVVKDKRQKKEND